MTRHHEDLAEYNETMREAQELRADIERLTEAQMRKDAEAREQIQAKDTEIERLTALLRRHHLRGAYWDHKLAVETRAALEKKS